MTRGMIFKGTPGEWSVLQSPSDPKRYFVVDSGGSCISCDDAYSLEDASISAAAPELLELLIEADKQVIWEFHFDEEFQGRVEAAIAKALGEQK